MAAAPTAKRILLHIGAPVHDFEVLAAFHAQHDIPSTNHNSVPLHFHHYHPSRHFDPENYGPLLIDLHAQTQRDVDTGTVELEIYDVGLSIWVDDMDERNWLGENLVFRIRDPANHAQHYAETREYLRSRYAWGRDSFPGTEWIVVGDEVQDT